MEFVNLTCFNYTNNTKLDTNNTKFEENLSDCSENVFLSERQRLEVPSYHLISQVTATIFFVIIFVVGVLGNLLVLLIVCLKRKMKTSVNIYLINLCIADILVLTVCMPTVLVDVYARDVWYFGEVMCSLVPFLENTVVHSSVLTLIAISVERYRVVNRPLLGIDDSISTSIKVVPVIWFISGISNIGWFYIADYRDSKQIDNTPIKVCRLPMVPIMHRFYVTFLSVLFFAIPFLILLILYCRICYILCMNRDDVSHQGLKNASQCRHRRRLRSQVINIIVSLILIFFIFHLPYRVVSLWFIFADKYEIHSLGIHKYFDILYSVRILFYFNHMINPIIYNFVSSKFRNALRYILTKREQRGSLLLSTNRKGQYNPPARPKKSQVIFMENDLENNVRDSKSLSSPTRQNINEFYPMYANIIEKHDTKEDFHPNRQHSNSEEPEDI